MSFLDLLMVVQILPLGAPASLSGLRDLIERRKEPGYRPFPIN